MEFVEHVLCDDSPISLMHRNRPGTSEQLWDDLAVRNSAWTSQSGLARPSPMPDSHCALPFLRFTLSRRMTGSRCNCLEPTT